MKNLKPVIGPAFAGWLKSLTPEKRKELLEYDKKIRKEFRKIFEAGSKAAGK